MCLNLRKQLLVMIALAWGMLSFPTATEHYQNVKSVTGQASYHSANQEGLTFQDRLPNTNETLQKYYAANNDEYFDGKLPRDIPVTFDKSLVPQEVMGQTSCILDMLELCKIRISTKYQESPAVYLETLIHEQCHIATWGKELDDHGPIFQRCMLRVAQAGGLKGLW